jgi:hypothetical protein
VDFRLKRRKRHWIALTERSFGFRSINLDSALPRRDLGGQVAVRRVSRRRRLDACAGVDCMRVRRYFGNCVVDRALGRCDLGACFVCVERPLERRCSGAFKHTLAGRNVSDRLVDECVAIVFLKAWFRKAWGGALAARVGRRGFVVRLENGRFVTRPANVTFLGVLTKLLSLATRPELAFATRLFVIRLTRTAMVFAITNTLPPSLWLVVAVAITAPAIGFAVPFGLAIVLPTGDFATALGPIIVRFAATPIGIGISLMFLVTTAAKRPSRFRLMTLFQIVTEIRSPLVVLIGRPNDRIQPFTDRHAGTACSLARSLPRFRTETS